MKVFPFSLINDLDCENLKSIVIGSDSFTQVSTLRILNNNNLVTIDIGKGSFSGIIGDDTTIFELKSILLS